MSKSAASELEIMRFIFNGTPFTWGSTTNLLVNLHNSDPTDNGVASEFTSVYGGYAPVVVPRTSEGFTVGKPTVNAANIRFPQCTVGSDLITHVSVSPEGFEQIIYYGVLATPLIVTPGVQPEFMAGTLELYEN